MRADIAARHQALLEGIRHVCRSLDPVIKALKNTTTE
jgi:hypothetical protein